MTTYKTLDELKNVLTAKGCEILAILPDGEDEIEFIRIPKTREKVRWTCASDPGHVSESLFQNIRNTLLNDEKDYVLCGCCSKAGINKGSRSYESVKELKDKLKEKGCTILAILPKGEKEIDFSGKNVRLPTIKETVRWTCAYNDSHISESTFSNLRKTLTDETKDKIACQGCSISKSKGGVRYEGFIELLERENWTMKSTKDEYENTKSILTVECDEGHESETSHNRFSEGHRCKECDNSTKRRHTIEDVAKEFEERGFKLLATEYINNSTDMPYICKCDRLGHMTYSNLTKNIDGCKICTGRWTYLQVEDYFSEMGCILAFATDKEFVLNSTTVTYECVCGTEHTSTWRLFKNGARCPGCTKILIQETCMSRYGETNVAKTKEAKEKTKKTLMEKFGVEHHMQIKEYVDKAKETNKKNHGGVHNLTLPDTREKSVAKYIELYGNKFGHVKEHQDKAKSVTIEKYGKFPFLISEEGKKKMWLKCGSNYFVGTKSFRDKMKQLYGEDHPMKVPEFFAKAQLTAFALKNFTLPSGKIIQIQGYEHFAIRDLLFGGVEEEDIVTGAANVPQISYKFDIKRKYYPDIFIPPKNLLIEIKSLYTFEKEYEKNVAKFTSACKTYNFELWIYSNKGVILVQRKFVNEK